MSKKLLLIINEDRFFLSHRTHIALLAREKGWDVTLVTKNTGRRKEIEGMGFKYLELPINPTGMNPKDELRLLKFLMDLFKKNPDAIIHLVGLKNMMWGGLAAKMIKTKGVLFAVSGLGTLFGEEKNEIISKGIQQMLKVGMRRKNAAVIFQNHDDEKLFMDNGIANKCFRFFIKGSGVDLKQYVPGEEKHNDPLKIIFTARMLREKGVEDLVAAAEILRPEYEGKIEFLLCGDLSNNPNALSKEDMESLTDGSYIKWLGHRNDIPELLSQSDIMCFPSFYREGVPKSLIEASACGLPLVTTDSVGCRDTVDNKKNGYLVNPHSPGEIAKALRKLINNPDKRKKMGIKSRQIAVKEYDVNAVAQKHLEIYNLLYVFNKNEK
ncbi:MAG: glycosyltransferase family 4 protein [Muribaculaceae bacterium]|nr:glycosyltransferase family 4 protein [Muribaculaceae bacterium]